MLCSDSAFRNGNYNNHKQNSYNQIDGFYQTLGDSIGVITEGYFEEDNKSGSDLQLVWYHKVDSDQWGTPVKIIPTGVKDLNANTVSVEVFPNPTDGYLNIRLSAVQQNETYFELFEINGRNIFDQKIKLQLTDMQLSGFSKGLYIWQVYENNVAIAKGKLALQ